MSSLLSEESSGEGGKMMIGNVLVVAGQFANAVQFIVEEVSFFFMHKGTETYFIGYRFSLRKRNFLHCWLWVQRDLGEFC